MLTHIVVVVFPRYRLDYQPQKMIIKVSVFERTRGANNNIVKCRLGGNPTGMR